MLREYRIESPSVPREPENTKTMWLFGGTGVTRIVKHDGSANIVTWDYSKDTYK